MRRLRPSRGPAQRAARRVSPGAKHGLSPSSLISLLWLASPALPIGGFAYSEGLEAGVQAGTIHDADTAASWLQDHLQLGLVRSDLGVLATAIAAWRRGDLHTLTELNAWVLQTRESAEFRLQTEQMGRSLLAWLRNQSGLASTYPQAADLQALNPTLPIAFALAFAQTQASTRDCLLTYCFGWAENMCQAAIKSIPLGQSAGQRVLAALSEAIPQAVDDALRLPPSQRQAFSPMLAIRSAQHETQYSRLFRS